jgi:CRP/FNR family cyclic AMP-dependent transcriptional regulator
VEFAGGYAYQKLRALGCSHNAAIFYGAKTTVKSFAAGSVIWRKGSHVNCWSAVINGLISAFVQSPNKPDLHISLYGEGDWFGEQSIITEKPSDSSFRCLTSVDLIQLPAECLLQLLFEENHFGAKVAKMSAWRLQRTSELLMISRSGSPLIKTVLGIAQISEVVLENAANTHPDPTSNLLLPINQSVLASLCGLSRSRLSNIINMLEDKEFVSLEYSRLVIRYPYAWQAFASRFRVREYFDLNPKFDDVVSELHSFVRRQTESVMSSTSN